MSKFPVCKTNTITRKNILFQLRKGLEMTTGEITHNIMDVSSALKNRHYDVCGQILNTLKNKGVVKEVNRTVEVQSMEMDEKAGVFKAVKRLVKTKAYRLAE